MISDFIQNHSEYELLAYLKGVHEQSLPLSPSDAEALLIYETEDYAVMGVIGLILHSKAHVLLGRKQPFDAEIKRMCGAIEVSQQEISEMANRYLDDDFTVESEFVLRKVMLEYPRRR